MAVLSKYVSFTARGTDNKRNRTAISGEVNNKAFNFRQVLRTVILFFFCLGCGQSWAEEGPGKGKVVFDIPPSNGIDALNLFADQADVQLIYPYELAGQARLKGLAGAFTLESGLQRLLKGSCLEATIYDSQESTGSKQGIAIMQNTNCKKPGFWSVLGTAIASAFLGGGQAVAQDEAKPGSRVLEEVVVTARKKEESFVDVPVVMSALSGEQITNLGISDLDQIARSIPQLQIGSSNGSVQGGLIALRGIAGPAGNPMGDSAVSFNIDGVQIAKTSVRRLGTFDLQGVEVLKGPQALYFGKNSPGGIITLRTGNPTEEFEGSISVGYETEAEEKRTEGYISGPLSDTVGYRIAGFYSEMDGWLENETPSGSFLDRASDYNSEEDSYAFRVTLQFDPSDKLSIRPKVAYGEWNGAGLGGTVQTVACPTAAPGFNNFGVPDDCKAGDKNYVAGYSPALADRRPIFKSSGEPFNTQKQLLAGLEISYDLTDEINFVSITGLFDTDFENAYNAAPTYTRYVAAAQHLENQEVSQEFRIDTTFDGPLNFTAGAFYAKTETEQTTAVALSLPTQPDPETATIIFANWNELKQEGEAYSFFLQGRYDLTDTVELSAGGRYSYEQKELPYLFVTGGNDIRNRITLAVDDENWYDFSPEVTLSWQPTDDLNLFFSYKEGFLSGGFNSGNTPFVNGGDTSYDPELVKGFEAGLKSYLLDRALQLNFAVYTYEADDLQVATFRDSLSFLVNAGKVDIKGAEMDFTYLTPLEGLTLRGAASYNKGEYDSFPNAPCYAGAPAPCVPNGTYDLSGTELVNAPEWTVSAGFDYYVPVGDNLELGFTGNATYSDSYLTEATSNPNGRMPSYTLLDLSVRLSDVADSWELALIGRNLDNEHVFVQSAQGASSPDVIASTDRGRQIMLRATYKF